MMTIPARGEYANETYFITMEEYLDLIACNHSQHAQELILFTDGVQNELIDFSNKRPRADTLTSIPRTKDDAQSHPILQKHPPHQRLVHNTDPILSHWLEEGQTTQNDDATILVLQAHP